MAQAYEPILSVWDGSLGWFDPSPTSITDDRTRARRIARTIASDIARDSGAARTPVVSTLSNLLRRRTARVVSDLYGS